MPRVTLGKAVSGTVPDPVALPERAPRSDAFGPFRRVAVPLLVNHALIPVGGLLLVVGATTGGASTRDLGAATLGAGLAIEAGVVAWSMRLTRRAASRRPTVGSPSDDSVRGCASCGWRGSRPRYVCPRCGRPLHAEFR